MIEEHFQKLLEKEWEEEEKKIIEKIMEGLLYYKRILPSSFKNDVSEAIKLCNRLKEQIEELQEKIKRFEN